jgi:hypothetical protein
MSESTESIIIKKMEDLTSVTSSLKVENAKIAQKIEDTLQLFYLRLDNVHVDITKLVKSESGMRDLLNQHIEWHTKLERSMLAGVGKYIFCLFLFVVFYKILNLPEIATLLLSK